MLFHRFLLFQDTITSSHMIPVRNEKNLLRNSRKEVKSRINSSREKKIADEGRPIKENQSVAAEGSVEGKEDYFFEINAG